jgi:hypothetical protein
LLHESISISNLDLPPHSRIHTIWNVKSIMITDDVIRGLDHPKLA